MLLSLPAQHQILRLIDDLTGIGDLAAYALVWLGRYGDAQAAVESGRAHLLRSQLQIAEAELVEADRARQLALAIDHVRTHGLLSCAICNAQFHTPLSPC